MSGIQPQGGLRERANWQVTTDRLRETYYDTVIDPGRGVVAGAAAIVNSAVPYVELQNAGSPSWRVNAWQRGDWGGSLIIEISYSGSLNSTADFRLSLALRQWGDNVTPSVSWSGGLSVPGPAVAGTPLKARIVSSANVIARDRDGLSFSLARLSADAADTNAGNIWIYCWRARIVTRLT